MERSEEIYRIGFEKLGDAPFNSMIDMAKHRARPAAIGRPSQCLWSGVEIFRDERLRTVFSFHPLLIGGNPFRATSIYCLIAFLEKSFGVHSAIGRHRSLVSGW